MTLWRLGTSSSKQSQMLINRWPIIRPFHTPEGVTLESGQAGRRHRYIRKAVIEAGTPTPEEVNLLDASLLDKIEHFLVV